MGSPHGFSLESSQLAAQSPSDHPAAATSPPGVDRAPAPGGITLRRLAYLTGALAVGLLVLGGFWRLFDLRYPASFCFDEHHFVENARNYIARRADWNDHPALGKLLLVPGILLFGDNGVGWRISSAILGLLLVALAGFNAAKIFGDRRVGLLTAAFVAIDGFFISYSRVALLDTPMTLFMFAAVALMLSGRSLVWFAAAALCVGLAVAVKWTGVCVLLVAPWLLWRRGWRPWHVAWMFAVAGAVYLAISAAALLITRQPISMAGLLGTNVTLLKHHTAFTIWDNAASSRWYSWPFLTHPILMHYHEVIPGMVRVTTSLGNVLLWYGTTAAVAATLYLGGRQLWRRVRALREQPAGAAATPVASAAAGAPAGSARVDVGGGLFVVGAMVALILPFVLTNRQSYIFHYLGAYGLGLGLLASWLIKLEQRFPRLVLAFVVLGAALSIAYAPVWTNALISRTEFLVRLPFPGWR